MLTFPRYKNRIPKLCLSAGAVRMKLEIVLDVDVG